MTFDDSLPIFVSFMHRELGRECFSRLLFLRGPDGKLTCVVPEDLMEVAARQHLSAKAAEICAPYVDNDGFAVATAEELLDERLADANIGLISSVQVDRSNMEVRLLDRRVMGGAWLEGQTAISPSKRLVFASLKGGVGRSTALCVLAAHLATSGLRVLAVDMDVEAPGIGSMLLSESTVPKFGLLDYLVETSIQGLGQEFYANLIAPSWVAEGRGIVSVIPAVGSLSLENPTNVLSKIARAYLGGSADESAGVTKKIQTLLDRIDATGEFDVVLLDARAGLHETTGSALLGLGGRILLFGTDQKQTEAGFGILFANLAMVERTGWQDRLVVVHAKATTNLPGREEFSKRMKEKFAESFITPLGTSVNNGDLGRNELEALSGVFQVEWEENSDENEARTKDIIDDGSRPVEVAAILESEGFRDFDPFSNRDLLTDAVYDSVYKDFLLKSEMLLNLAANSYE